MKKIILSIVLAIIISFKLFAQVIISPYIVYTDEHNKFGSMIVQNESMEPYEISISFIFGYPISDSLGNRTMFYEKNPNAELPSLNDWIKAFPKKFVLQPKERQTVRLMIQPPLNIDPGTYWTRIVTSSTQIEKNADSMSTGVNAKLRFVLNQVTTAIFRKGEAITGITIGEPELYMDSTANYQLLYPLHRTGNTPYFGYFYLKIWDSNGLIIKENKEYLSVYYDLIRNYLLESDKFATGKYTAELTIVFNEKEDIPESNLKPIADVKNNFEFTIP